MAKATVNAKEFVSDIRSGMSDAELMSKHNLTSKQFRAVCQTLLDAGKLQPSDLGEEPPTSGFTFGVASTCPHCGAMKLVDSGECPECGQATTRVATKSDAFDLNAFEKIDNATADASADNQRGSVEEPETTEPQPPRAESESRTESVEPGPVEATAAPPAGASQAKSEGPSLVRRVLTGALAAALPLVAILVAAGWYLGVIGLPFDQGPDAPAVTAQKAPVAVPSPVKKAKPAVQPAEARHDTRPAQPAPPAKSAPLPAAPSPPPKAASATPAAETARSKPFQEVPAGASNETVTQAPRADTSSPPESVLPPKAVPAAATAEAQPKPSQGAEQQLSVAEKPRESQPSRAAATQRPDNLASAVRARDVAAARRFLDRGDDVNARDEDGVTPCMQAAVQGDAEMVELLLQRGADVSPTDNMGSTALSLALERGNPRVVAMLLARDRSKGAAELFDACRTGRGDVVKVLLQSGANPNSRDEQGNTLLMLAAGSGDLPLVKMLLERGADINARNREGTTALAWAYSSPLSESASLRTRRDVVRLLKQHGGKSGASSSAAE